MSLRLFSNILPQLTILFLEVVRAKNYTNVIRTGGLCSSLLTEFAGTFMA